MGMGDAVRSVIYGAIVSAVSFGAAGAEPARLTGPEFPVEQQALIDATLAFFDSVEAADEPTGRERSRVPKIGVPLSVIKTRFPGDDTEPLTRMGPVAHLTGYRISWYPVDQLLGTVDFMGTWGQNENLVCGYLTWDMSNPSAPVLQSVSASFVDIDDLSKGSEVEIHRDLLRANCAFGEIEQNFRLFDLTG